MRRCHEGDSAFPKAIYTESSGYIFWFRIFVSICVAEAKQRRQKKEFFIVKGPLFIDHERQKKEIVEKANELGLHIYSQ